MTDARFPNKIGYQASSMWHWRKISGYEHHCHKEMENSLCTLSDFTKYEYSQSRRLRTIIIYC